MSTKIIPALSFVLVAALAQAQARPAPKTSPRPPKPAAPLVAPIVPDLSDLSGLAALADLDLRLDLDALGSKIDLQLAPAFELALGPGLDALSHSLEGFEAWGALGQDRWTGRAGDSESIQYSRGTEYLDQRRYQQALEAFEKVVAANGKRTDGALYWKAYCLSRLGRGSEALSTLDDLLKKYPSSRWANDARALQVELRQASGRSVNPQQESDEELKLIALNGIIARDPERAIPLVEQILNSSASPRMKERALFVLGQSGSPRAKTLLTDIAKGKGGNPDLQMKALEYLGVVGGGPDVPLLVEIYKSTSDVDVKRRVIRSLALSGGGRAFRFDFAMPNINIDMARAWGEAAKATGKVMSDADRARVEAEVKAEMDRVRGEVDRAKVEADRAAREAESAERRTARSAEREKARQAKAKEASDALWQLYQGESSVDLKREILRNMFFGDQSERLILVARTEKNPELRQAALRGLMFNKSPKTADTLVALYREEKDPSTKREIVDALGAMSAAAPLVQIARQETDPQLRKTIVQRLSYMKDKEATDYLEELLKK